MLFFFKNCESLCLCAWKGGGGGVHAGGEVGVGWSAGPSRQSE